MRSVLPRASAGIFGVVVLGFLTYACSSGSSQQGTVGTAGTSGDTPAVVDVQVSSMFVTVQNQAGQALERVQIAIQVAGRRPFVFALPRMESGERRELAFGDFRSDGSPFNPRLTRAQDVMVTAVDLRGETHTVTTPWTR